jgi:general secretion pathway protein N
MSKLWVTRDRPLFSSSRRPPPPRVVAVPPPPPATAEPVAPAAPPFTLVGTIIGEDKRVGIFFNETSKITMSIRLGDVDSGWTLRSIDPRSAVMESNGRLVTLDLPGPSATAALGAQVDAALGPRRWKAP